MNIFNLILQSTTKAEYRNEYNQQGNINGSVAQDSRLTTCSDGYRMYIFPESPETLALPLDTENIIMSSTPEGLQISRTDRNAINNPYYQNNQHYVNPAYNQNNLDYANPNVYNDCKSRTVAIGRIPDPKNTKEMSKKEDKKDKKDEKDKKDKKDEKESSSVKSNKTQKAKNSCIGLKNNIDFIYAIGFSLLG